MNTVPLETYFLNIITATCYNSLFLRNTRFPGKLSKELAKSLTVNETLKILRLGRNPFREEELEVLVASLAASQGSGLHIIGLEVSTFGK